MKSVYQKKEEWMTFYDGEGNQVKRKTEVRFDPLTNESSRLVFDPGMTFTPPDYTHMAEQTSGAKCPFCPENILKLTPIFPTEIAKEGRLVEGEAIVFPNLFPYSKHNAVVAIAKQHYVPLEQFTGKLIKDALVASQTYINNVMVADSDATYSSINWNYLPLSGGSIIHPHMHVIVSESPTNYQLQLERSNEKFKQKYGTEYFTALYEYEKEIDERWIGEHGNIAWMHAFAPKSHNDFIAIFTKATTITEITKQDWYDFVKGIQSVFSILSKQGFASFNMVLTQSRNGNESPVHARIIPRLTLGGLATSDMNFFQTLHGEPLTYKIPEEIAKMAQGYFLA